MSAAGASPVPCRPQLLYLQPSEMSRPVSAQPSKNSDRYGAGMTYRSARSATISRTCANRSLRILDFRSSMPAQSARCSRIAASTVPASGTAPMFGISMPFPGMMNSQQAAIA